MLNRQNREISTGERLRALVGFVLLLAFPGCFLRKSEMTFDEQLNHFQTMAAQTQYPEVEVSIDPSLTSEEPLTLDTPSREPWPLSPEEAVQRALANSSVLRDLGGQVLQSPFAARTIHNPAIVETDPRFGVEAALSAFDAQFFSAFYAEKNDYVANNKFLGGGTNKLQQDRNVLTMQLSKRAVTGTEYYLRHNIDYDSNNAPGNLFPSVYNTNVEAEFRHPLLQGSGVEFNRIAGPGATPGNYNGVVIARLNADVSLLDFEIGVRDLVNNVENAYWDLYFAYRDLEAKVDARDQTRLIWQEADTRAPNAGRADLEPQAREQYFRYKEDVQNALSGRVVDGTRSNNGSSGGTFRGWAGVQVAERRLRLLMGVAINDGRMILPTHEPFAAEIVYDWEQISGEAIVRRAELRRQRLLVKRREMELCASRNFLLPRLDAFGRYRWRGFGDDLLSLDRVGSPEFDNAYQELTSGEYQEWRVGAELRFPIGFRQAHAGVRNAQLLVARDKAVLVEQERQIIYDLSNSVSDIKRSYKTLQDALNRRISAQKQIEILKEKKGSLNPDLWINAMLDALQRVTDATTHYHASRVEYIIAVKNLHLEKGSLLEYNNVFLAENLPAVVSPSNGPDPAPEGEGPAMGGPESVLPGTSVPETTNEGIRGPEFESGPAAAPPNPSSAQNSASPNTRFTDTSNPTPLAAELRAAREAAEAPEGTNGNRPNENSANDNLGRNAPAMTVLPRIVTEHPTDGRPPVRPGEGEPMAEAPEAPRAQIRDMWVPGRYADPSVAVPRSSASNEGVESVIRAPNGGGIPALPATGNSNRIQLPEASSVPSVPETSRELPPDAGSVGPDRTNVPTPPEYIPAPPSVRNGASFGDPSVVIPSGVKDSRRDPLVPALANPSMTRSPITAAPDSRFDAPAANPAQPNSRLTSAVRPSPSMTPNRSPALDGNEATVGRIQAKPFRGARSQYIVSPNTESPSIVSPSIVSPSTVSPNTESPNTVQPGIVSPRATSSTIEAPAARVATLPRATPVTEVPEAPAVPTGINTPAGMRRTSSEFRGSFADPSVSIPPSDLPRVTVPPVSARRVPDESSFGEGQFSVPATGPLPAAGAAPKVDPATSSTAPALRRLPSTSRVVPASREEAIGSPAGRVNQAQYLPPR